MTYEEAQNLYRLRIAQIHLSVIYELDFLRRLGKKGLDDLRNQILDDIIELRNIIRNVQQS